ncbi:MAG: hypothetical protein IPJ77_00325 [Planctomycetes bacterium]|nr:hypothetical protein [Planctomycetota bacterium]
MSGHDDRPRQRENDRPARTFVDWAAAATFVVAAVLALVLAWNARPAQPAFASSSARKSIAPAAEPASVAFAMEAARAPERASAANAAKDDDRVRIVVRDDAGRDVLGVGLEIRAHGAATWSPGEFELDEHDSVLRVPARLFESHRVRIGAPWHVWNEFDPALVGSVCELERAGAIRAAVLDPDPARGARWRIVGPSGEEHDRAAEATAALFDRLRLGVHQVELSVVDAGVVESFEVVVEPGRTQSVFASLPNTGDARLGALVLTLSGRELPDLARSFPLVAHVEADAGASAIDELSDRLHHTVLDVFGSTWSTRFDSLQPGLRSVLLEPLGIRRSFELRPGATATLRIELDDLAWTAVTFHQSTTGTAFVPQAVSASLVANDLSTTVAPWLASDGSLAHVFCTAPGELVVAGRDEAWAAAPTRVQVGPGWNAAVVEAVPVGRVTVQLDPGRFEVPEGYWGQIVALRADGSSAVLGSRLRLGPELSARALELVVPANEPVEVRTPAVLGREAQRLHVVVPSGQQVERRVPAL